MSVPMIEVSTSALCIAVATPEDSYPYIADLGTTRLPPRSIPVVRYAPLVEIRLNGEGNAGAKTGSSLIGSALSQRLRVRSHAIQDDPLGKRLDVDMYEPSSGLTVIAHILLLSSIPVARFSSTIRNDSKNTHIVHQITSMAIGGVSRTDKWWDEHDLSVAFNSWFREAQWVRHTLPSLGLDDFGFAWLESVDPPLKQTQAYHKLTNRSTFSTQGHLPMGLLQSEDDTWLWQVENNGAWRSEVGDWGKSLYIATCGPEAGDHDWRLPLKPGDSFSTCWTALTRLAKPAGTDEAFSAFTRYRRQIIRPHPDHANLPVIFNDYMNCLMGDPTEDKVTALIEPAAKAGAEYLVIDAGWYADDGGWWDAVGEWEPSTKRFASGFKPLLDSIHRRGLIPGLWIEPEVIGVRCPLASHLPNEMFLQRDGVRTIEKGRYHLDFRHPETRSRMDKVIDRLVTTYRVGYFKFDYNIEHVLGTDVDCFSAGQGQQGHSTAYLAWVGGLLDRYPGLVIENCSSGGMRMDYGMLGVHTLQSTSDQQDPVLYAAISCAIPTAVTPQQSASWAYPQKDWPDEINALTVANSLLGRVHLSGRLDALEPHQFDLVSEGMKVYKAIRQDLRTATPFWPLGLPGWHDDWLALGMKCDRHAYLMVWRRGGESQCHLPIDFLAGRDDIRSELLYPVKLGADISWEKGSLSVGVPAERCARLIRLEFGP